MGLEAPSSLLRTVPPRHFSCARRFLFSGTPAAPSGPGRAQLPGGAPKAPRRTARPPLPAPDAAKAPQRGLAGGASGGDLSWLVAAAGPYITTALAACASRTSGSPNTPRMATTATAQPSASAMVGAATTGSSPSPGFMYMWTMTRR